MPFLPNSIKPRATTRRRTIVLVIFFMLSLTARADTTIVAAASNLKFALHAVSQAYTAASGLSIRLVFGSSGNFYRQIRQGAPYQVYISADESYVHQLQAAGLTEGDSFIYGVGRLVYFAPAGSTLKPADGMADLQRAVSEQRVTRFAIANPNHAPYGKAALQTLQKLSVYPAIRPALLLGENVSQAAQFAISDSADGGLLAYSLVFADQVSDKGSYLLVPDSLHTPLRQRATLVKGAGEKARHFYQFLRSERAQAILEQYGFNR